MIPMCRRPPCRKAVSLVELLVALGVLALLATGTVAALLRSLEASALRQAEMQTAAILRDAIARALAPVPAASGGMQAQVVCTPGSGTLVEQIQVAGGAWQSVSPAGVSLQLPGGVTVQRTTWPNDTLVVSSGDMSTGMYQSYHTTSAGSVTLTTPHGMTATVYVTGAGTVWY